MNKKNLLDKHLVSKISIPIYANIPKNKKFLNFLNNTSSNYEEWQTCHKDIQALEVTDVNININSKKCIGCLNCIISNPSSIIMNDNTKKDLMKLLFETTTNIQDLVNDTKNLFANNRIELPLYDKFERNFNGFEEYTTTNEVEHIALWAVSVLKFLSSKANSRIGREIEIFKSENPRDGRLDICVLSNSEVLVVEAKTDFKSLLSENRYRQQIPSYFQECKKIVDEYNKDTNSKLKLLVLLLIGGKETDLYPPNHSDCTSTVGNQASSFYDELTKNNIKFVSANSLWILCLNAILSNKKICWDLLFPKLFSQEDSIGLVSSGLVVKKASKFSVEPISDVLKSSSSRLLP